ncbi:1,4-dihydroxy-2-naphthoate polyprenyltransferase, partial [candidate division KSB1 bacterium]
FRLHRHPFAMATLFIFVPAYPLIKTMFRYESGVILNEVLAGTGKLMLIYSLIFSIGWLI